MNKKLLLLVFVFCLISFASAIPQTFNVHGKLSNSSGALTGTYSMEFKIYSDYEGGSALWTDSYSVTTDSSGVYNVILKDIDLPFSAQYYLGVNVEADGEMVPRMNLTSSAYSFRANVSDNLDSSRNYYAANLNVSGDVCTTSGVCLSTVSGVASGEALWTGNFTNGLSGNLILNGHYLSGDGGNEGVYVDGSGNVGIGTTTPGYKLDVNGVINASDVLINGSSISSAISGDYLALTGGTMSGNIALNGNWLSGDGGNEGVYVDSSGNVGIGTGSPSEVLSINGTGNKYLKITSSSANNAGIIFQRGTDSDTTADYSIYDGVGLLKFDFNVSGSGSTGMVMNSVGNVGIGTGSPGYALEVNGSVKFTGGHIYGVSTNPNVLLDDITGAALQYSSSRVAVASGKVSINAGTVIGGNYYGSSPPSNGLIVEGNVGIGTTSPSTKLNIYENSTNTVPQLTIQQDGTGDAGLRLLAGGNAWSVGVDNSGGETFMINNVNYGVDSSSKFVITQTGNVGIGTNTPQNKLNVVGDGNITGNLYVNGELVGGSGTFVPYTGASSDLDLGAYKIKSSNIKYDDTNQSVLIGTSTGDTLQYVTALGYAAGLSNNNTHGTFIGRYAGYSNTGSSVTTNGFSSAYQNTGSYVTANGAYSAYQNTGSSVTTNGFSSAYQNTGSSVTATGYTSARENTGSYVTANGDYSARGNTGSSVTANGYASARENTGSSVTANGYASARENTGSSVTANGYYSAYQNTGDRLTAMGYEAGMNNTADNVVAIGYQAGKDNTVANQFIVQQANVNAVPLIQGDFASGLVNVNSLNASSMNVTTLYVNGEAVGGSGTFVPYAGATANVVLGAYNVTTTGRVTAGELNVGGDVVIDLSD